MRDVFLSHASQDKQEFVIPFAQKLTELGISFWLDEAEIQWGDKISKLINEGLAASRFVIVFLTPSFVGRNWTEAELSAALTRENDEGRTVVLPIVTDPKVTLNRYPLLRDKKYLEWKGTPDSIAAELLSLVIDSRKRSLELLRAVVLDRISGKRMVARTLTELLAQPESDIGDYIRLELAIHELSRLGVKNAADSVITLCQAPIVNSFIARSCEILRALCLISVEDFDTASKVIKSVSLREKPSELQSHYLAAQEGIVQLALGQINEANAAWEELTPDTLLEDKEIYPFTTAGRAFGRALIAVVTSNRPVEKIAENLRISEYRGIAHFAAETARMARLTPRVLSAIETWGAAESWKASPTKRSVANRLHSYEKALLFKAGSLFGLG
jgi:hypothetical protein